MVFSKAISCESCGFIFLLLKINYENKKKRFNDALDQVDDDKATTITTTTVSLSTNGWQPGQQKNCTEPGEYYYQTLILFSMFLCKSDGKRFFFFFNNSCQIELSNKEALSCNLIFRFLYLGRVS